MIVDYTRYRGSNDSVLVKSNQSPQAILDQRILELTIAAEISSFLHQRATPIAPVVHSKPIFVTKSS